MPHTTPSKLTIVDGRIYWLWECVAVGNSWVYVRPGGSRIWASIPNRGDEPTPEDHAELQDTADKGYTRWRAHHPGVRYRHFRNLKARVESIEEVESHVLSFSVYDEHSDDWPAFGHRRQLKVVLYRPGEKTTVLLRTGRFSRELVDDWIDGYIRPRVLAWYGFTERGVA